MIYGRSPNFEFYLNQQIYPKYYPNVGHVQYDNGKIFVELISEEDIVDGVTRTKLAAKDHTVSLLNIIIVLWNKQAI